jgi:inorganic triphosphatase YgiF
LLPPADAHWDAGWIRLFRELGRARDRRYVEELQSRLEAAGGPALQIGSDAQGAADPVSAVRSPAFQDALLAMLALLHGNGFGSVSDADAKHVKVLLRKRLRKLRQAVLADGRHFDALPAQRQHRVRKRAKRLRYLAEFAQGMFPGREAKEFIAALKPLQDALGDYNDEWLALRHYSRQAGAEPRAWFGAGWLGARRAANALACTEAIGKFADVRPFWKK